MTTNQKISVGQISASGSANGQVLASNGTTVYWTTGGTGYNGSVGFTGSVGYTGSQGSQGNIGYTGSIGFTGSIGYTGSAGAGYTGSGGSGYSGSQGSIGYTGSAGSASGGSSVTVSSSSPLSANSGDLWYNSTLGTMFIYYNDGNSSQWVQVTPSGGGASGSGAASSVFATFAGFNTIQTGTQRRYFNNSINIYKLTSWVSTTSNSALTISLNKNGSSIANTTIPAGSSIANTTFSNVQLLADTDYMTIDITAGSGTDIGVRVDYS